MLTTSILFGLITSLTVFALCSWRLPPSQPKHLAAVKRTHRRPAKHRLTAASVRPFEWLHDAPDQLPSPLEAHRIMQSHLGCRTSFCARKAAAFDVLVGSGTIRPRS